jgi:hypothetical protein
MDTNTPDYAVYMAEADKAQAISMPSLLKPSTFVATINDGPGALDTTLFIGSPERIILGLKAHANTISHAPCRVGKVSLTRVEVGGTIQH